MGIQINKLNTLIGELLDFTKIQECKLIYNEGFFDFNDFMKGVVEDMRHTTVMHKISYFQSADARIFGDKEKLSQVVNNLISNGINIHPTLIKFWLLLSCRVMALHYAYKITASALLKWRRIKFLNNFTGNRR